MVHSNGHRSEAIWSRILTAADPVGARIPSSHYLSLGGSVLTNFLSASIVRLNCFESEVWNVCFAKWTMC